MPTFEITSPDGRKFQVDGPEGSTAEQALERVKGQSAKPASDPPSAVGDFFKSMPRHAVTGLMNAATAGGQAAAHEMGQPELAADMPSPEQATKAIESGVTGELPKPRGRAGRFGGAIAETLANPASWVGPGSMALKAGAGAASALGSEGAGQLTEGTALEPYARFAGGVAAGTGAGVVAAERGAAKLTSQLPSREKIKDASTAGYEKLKTLDVQIEKDAAGAMLADIKSSLHADNFRDYLAPNTFRAIAELNTGKNLTIGDLDGVRKLLGRVATNGVGTSEGEAARQAVNHIDGFLGNPPPGAIFGKDADLAAPILKHAQGNWASQKQLGLVEDASIRGQHRAGVSGSGANRINTARQEIRKILDSDKKSRGLSQEVKDKMEEIVMGTWGTNTSRMAGKFAPSGPVSATTSILTGMGLGPVMGAGVAAGGWLSKHLGEYLTDRQIRQLEQLMRSESPIGKPVAKGIAPELEFLRTVPPAAAARSALTSPLATGGP